MGKLVLLLPDGGTLDIPLCRERMTIGRRTGNDVCLPYPAVSGNHAVVVTLLTGSVLEDLGSTNGTLVNGKKISKYFLHDGDGIDIARQKLVYLADAGAVLPRQEREPAARRLYGTATMTRSLSDTLPLSIRGDREPEAVPMSEAEHPDAQTPVTPPSAPNGPTLNVINGPSAGRVFALHKDESLIGRIGAQVAAVRRTGGEFHLVPVEGDEPPRVNGMPVPVDGVELHNGDTIEVAAINVTFFKPERTPENVEK